MDISFSKRLVFVYNANSGIGNSLLDSAHKILNPSTYKCNLCAITHGVFSENNKWKDFRRKSGLEMQFFHRDEFQKQYAHKMKDMQSFPVVYILCNGRMEMFLTNMEINALHDQEDLILAVQEKLKTNNV